jgi:hypothetical protein
LSHLPDAIHVRVFSRDKPVASLLVLTRIVMHELNDYWGVFGPTGADGEVTIRRDELVRAAHVTRGHYEAEFADVETHLAGLIEVRIMDEAAIDRALEAAEQLPEYPYPPGYLATLREARDALVRMGRILMEFEVSAEGGDCEVKAETPI